MNEREDKEKELERREKELQKKEQEIRLRELETEIDRQQKESHGTLYSKDTSEFIPPLYETKKHKKSESKFTLWSRKVTKIAKFVGFTVAGIAMIRVGMFVGMWITWGLMALIVAFVAYKLYLEESDRDR
jgi:hypothetical protein